MVKFGYNEIKKQVFEYPSADSYAWNLKAIESAFRDKRITREEYDELVRILRQNIETTQSTVLDQNIGLLKKKKIGWVKKAVAVTGLSFAMLIAGVNLPATKHLARNITLNVMSNTGFQESDRYRLLKQPETYTQKGPYHGFLNIASQAGNEVGDLPPELFEPDPKATPDPAKRRIDFNAIYLELEKNTLPISQYKPTKLTGTNSIVFYSLKDYVINTDALVGKRFPPEAIKKILGLKVGEVLTQKEAFGKNFHISAGEFTTVDLNSFTLSFGRDSSGIYTSVYDVWDFQPNAGYFTVRTEEKNDVVVKLAGVILPKIGTPIHFYDRFYWPGIK